MTETGNREQGTGNGGETAAARQPADQYPAREQGTPAPSEDAPSTATQSSALSTRAPYAKPLPDPNPVSRPFWDAARNHTLLIQRSLKTGKHVFYPRAISPYGAGDHLEWVQASGKGSVYSFTVARRPTAPGWGAETPYVIALIELEEGVHMTGNIVGCDPADVRVGMPVEATYADVTPEVTLVQWRPAPS